MRESIGCDWKDYFDIIMYDTNKPTFFNTTDSPEPFYNIRNEQINDFSEYMKIPQKGEDKIIQKGHA